MVTRLGLVLAVSFGLFFSPSGTQRRDRQCITEFAARQMAEKTVLPDYPADLESPGSVFAVVVFDKDGQTAKVKVYEAPGPQFADAVSRALEQWKLKRIYNAAGEPIETQTGVRFLFIFEEGKGRVEAATDEEQKNIFVSQKACASRL